MRLKNFVRDDSASEPIIRISGRIGGMKGESKSTPGGFKFGNAKHKCVVVRKKARVNSSVCVFGDIPEHIDTIKPFRKP